MTNIAHERLITNKLLLDHLDMWDEFDIKSVDDNKTVRYYNRIMNHIDDEIEAGLKWLDSEEAEKYFKEESQYHHKVFQSLEDEWDSILESKYDSIEALLSEVYQRGKAKGYTDMREHVRYTEADKQALRIATEYNYHLINKIDNDVRNEIKNKIISGFLAGDNPNLIAPKIQAIAGEQLEGSTFTPRQRATMIAKTEVSRVQNTGMLQSYVNEGYTEVKILTAEDNNVCATCLEYAYEFNKDDDLIYGNHGKEKIHNIIELIKGGSFPPFHPLCRCTYLSVWKTKTKPPKKPYIIDLTPESFKDFSRYDSEDFEYYKLSKNKIPGDLPQLLKDELINFDTFLDDPKWEYGYVANLITGEVSSYRSDKYKWKVNLNPSRVEVTSEKGNSMIATHCHLGLEPFNYKDFEVLFKMMKEVEVKFMVVHTPEDIFIAEFEDNALENSNLICNEVKNDYKNMMERKLVQRTETFGADALWDNYINNKILNKYIRFRRISKND